MTAKPCAVFELRSTFRADVLSMLSAVNGDIVRAQFVLLAEALTALAAFERLHSGVNELVLLEDRACSEPAAADAAHEVAFAGVQDYVLRQVSVLLVAETAGAEFCAVCQFVPLQAEWRRVSTTAFLACQRCLQRVQERRIRRRHRMRFQLVVVQKMRKRKRSAALFAFQLLTRHRWNLKRRQFMCTRCRCILNRIGIVVRFVVLQSVQLILTT